MSPKRSRRTADVLRFPGRALDPLADDQPDRIDLCDDPATSSPDQGQRHTEGKPDDDVQARRSRSEEMAAPARLGTVNACSRRKGFRGRSAAGRRLIHLLGTQHLTIPQVLSEWQGTEVFLHYAADPDAEDLLAAMNIRCRGRLQRDDQSNFPKVHLQSKTSVPFIVEVTCEYQTGVLSGTGIKREVLCLF